MITKGDCLTGGLDRSGSLAHAGIRSHGWVTSVQNGKIAFVRLRERRNLGIHLMEADGSAVRLLADGGVALSFPCWSPDGTRLVALGSGIGPCQLYVVHADGMGIQAITQDRSIKLRPAWSPDGSQIVFERAVDRTGYHLFVVGSDGRGLRQITGSSVNAAAAGGTWDRPGDGPGDNPALRAEEMPAWSPDGSRIAFAGVAPRRSPDRPEGARHIYTVAPSGSDTEQLTDGPVHDSDPAWSPDGTRIAFTRHVDGEWIDDPAGLPRSSAVRLHVMHADGTRLRRLTEQAANYMDPCWSPDGTKLVFSKAVPAPTRIMVIDASGAGERPLTNPDLDGDYHPSWQPVP
jgi:TolB protein